MWTYYFSFHIWVNSQRFCLGVESGKFFDIQLPVTILVETFQQPRYFSVWKIERWFLKDLCRLIERDEPVSVDVVFLELRDQLGHPTNEDHASRNILQRLGYFLRNILSIYVCVFFIPSQLLAFPVGRAGSASPWEPSSSATLTRRREPASPATPTRRLMKWPTAQHGGTHMERQYRKRDNQSDWCLYL